MMIISGFRSVMFMIIGGDGCVCPFLSCHGGELEGDGVLRLYTAGRLGTNR